MHLLFAVHKDLSFLGMKIVHHENIINTYVWFSYMHFFCTYLGFQSVLSESEDSFVSVYCAVLCYKCINYHFESDNAIVMTI